MKQSKVAMLCTGFCGLSCLASLFVYAAGNLQAKQASTQESARFQQEQAARVRALEIVAKDYQRQGCWIMQGEFFIGRIVPPNSKGGYPPTSCIRSEDYRFYSYISKDKGALQMQQVFTLRELQNQLSRMQ